MEATHDGGNVLGAIEISDCVGFVNLRAERTDRDEIQIGGELPGGAEISNFKVTHFVMARSQACECQQPEARHGRDDFVAVHKARKR